MQDKQLIKKIGDEVEVLCGMIGYKRLTKLAVTVNYKSHVNETNLLKYLQHKDKKVFGAWTQLQVSLDDIQEKTAIIHNIEGEKI